MANKNEKKHIYIREKYIYSKIGTLIERRTEGGGRGRGGTEGMRSRDECNKSAYDLE